MTPRGRPGALRNGNGETETVSAMANTQYVPNIRRRYIEKAVPEMMKKFGYKNVNQVPRLEKIVINMGVGDAITDAKILEAAVKDLDARSRGSGRRSRARRPPSRGSSSARACRSDAT